METSIYNNAKYDITMFVHVRWEAPNVMVSVRTSYEYLNQMPMNDVQLVRAINRNLRRDKPSLETEVGDNLSPASQNQR